MRLKKRGGSSSSSRRRGIERMAVFVMLMVAWAWIMVTFGMVFYHGYYKKKNNSSTGVVSPVRGGGTQPLPFLPRKNRGEQLQQSPNHNENTNHRKRGSSSSSSSSLLLQPYESPLLIFTCNRDNYLKQTLDDIRRYIPQDCSMGCPIIISQDGRNADVINVIRDYQAKFQQDGIPLVHIVHKSALRGGHNAYEALAVHYGWALGQVFDGKALASGNNNNVIPQRVLILEEDLHVAPDLFGYFAAMAPILDADPLLFAVSAFNDNGFESHVKDATRVLRSDFFPGLGWMMTRKLWKNELQGKWPDGYWDDWMRDPGQRQGRHILRPEVSRTYHFGFKGGASQNQFGDRLSKVKLNDTPVQWDTLDLSYLSAENHFDRNYWNVIQAARHVDSINEALEQSKETDVQLDYTSLQEFQHLAKQLGLMDDEKAGILRTSYKGVVETRPHGEHLLLLTPPLQKLEREFAANVQR